MSERAVEPVRRSGASIADLLGHPAVASVVKGAGGIAEAALSFRDGRIRFSHNP